MKLPSPWTAALLACAIGVVACRASDRNAAPAQQPAPIAVQTTREPPREPANAAPDPARDPAPAELRRAMRAFEASLRAQDVDAFLGLFSRTRPWRAFDSLEAPERADTVTYAQLAADLRGKRGKYEYLFDAGGDDCLRDYVVDHYAGPWVWHDRNRFAPPDTDGQSVWVEWQNDGTRWVVAAIAMPSA